MEQLLPYYERELVRLRGLARDFAERYPQIARRLGMSGEASEDAHIEHLIQSCAFIGARINKKLDDCTPEFTDALLDVLYPHYLRPFPSCAITQFSFVKGKEFSTVPLTIGRGTSLKSNKIDDVACVFKTAYDVNLMPVHIADAMFHPISHAPAKVRLPASATACISLTIACNNDQFTFDHLQCRRIRIYLHGAAPFVAVLRDCLLLNTITTYVEVNDSGIWLATTGTPLQEVGYGENEALLSFSARSHSAYRLLSEHAAFPEKFNFLNIDFQGIGQLPLRSHRFTLHLILAGVSVDSSTAQHLASLSSAHFQLGCTPVINLFEKTCEPIKLESGIIAYTVLPNAERPMAYEVHTVESAVLQRTNGASSQTIPLRPFYSLLHSSSAATTGHYWLVQRNKPMSLHTTGFETEISLLDSDANIVDNRHAADNQEEVLYLQLTCSNRDLPTQLHCGLPAGDLVPEQSAGPYLTHLLTQPSRSLHVERGGSMRWRILSYLSLNHLSLSQQGLPALKDMLHIYDIPGKSLAARQIDALIGLSCRAVPLWITTPAPPSFTRGIEILLTLDERSFVDSSLQAFIRVLDHFFALYVRTNSFSRLVVLSVHTGLELYKCHPRNGEAPLV